MCRIIQTSVFKRKLPPEQLFKIGEPIVGIKAIAPINGEEKVGTIVYKRKAEYRGLPWDAEE
ncbi:hypothetical protein HPT25_07690 [Bacillus sp. BRMEA1]|uniref:hypothetical protein n=1 Tax=Neobacillus endophyticus TaxID=2738405 RepID=UPI00156762FD|nr:hypothetical protein [Neobacillus endophyticus]NRD77380.1 hypothetical protein [Neobacillus endophyticus]